MKTLIFQYYDGARDYVEMSRNSVSKYAESIKADYQFFSRGVPLHCCYGTFYPFLVDTTLLSKYDLIVYLDSDVLISKEAKDIRCVSDRLISMAKMNSGPLQSESLSNDVNDLMKAQGCEKWIPQGHFNAGVVCFPRAIYIEFGDFLRYYLPKKHSNASTRREDLYGHLPFGGYDQYFLNWYGYPSRISHLGWEFNFHMSRLDHSKRFEVSFIHYHGDNKELMKQDYRDEQIQKHDSN